MLSRIAAVTARRVADAWPAVAAVALAVVLACSGVLHLRAGEALLRHYDEAVGAANFAYVVGALQWLAAAALLSSRGRRAACAALAGVALAGIAHQFATGRAGEATWAACALLATALAIAVGDNRRRSD